MLDTVLFFSYAAPRLWMVSFDYAPHQHSEEGIDFYSLNKAFMGVPAAPKKQAIALCEWAIRAAKGDVDYAGESLRAWARKNGKGLYDRRLIEAPEITYGS